MFRLYRSCGIKLRNSVFLVYFSILIRGYSKVAISKECLVIATLLGLRSEPDSTSLSEPWRSMPFPGLLFHILIHGELGHFIYNRYTMQACLLELAHP